MARAGTAFSYTCLALCFFVCYSIAFIGLYFEFFGPNEAPIYFDRANRKVYYVYRSKWRRFILFGPSRIEARSVDWDLVDAELQTTVGGSTASIRSHNHLVFLMRTSQDDPTIHGFYALSNLEFPNELWEYIRRYMEEGAPPLQAGEAPPGIRSGKNVDLADGLRKRARSYRHDWKTMPGTMIWVHLLIPVLIPFFFINRLVVWSSQKVVWPPEVKPALGPPLTEAEVEADTSHTLRASAAPEHRARHGKGKKK